MWIIRQIANLYHLLKTCRKSIKFSFERGTSVTVAITCLSFFFFLFSITLPLFTMRVCYYDLLGIDRQAAPIDIKKAYRQQALVWHPGIH